MDDLAWKSRQEGRTMSQAHFLQIPPIAVWWLLVVVVWWLHEAKNTCRGGGGGGLWASGNGVGVNTRRSSRQLCILLSCLVTSSSNAAWRSSKD